MKKFFERCWSNKSKGVFVLLAASSLMFLVVGSFGAGMSGDDEIHNVQAAHIYDYYRTFGKDTVAAVVTDDYNLPLYGQVVDNFAYALSRWFGISDIMQVRHTTNTVCGWLAILFTALMAFRLADRKWLAAILTFLLFVFSPRFIGHSFNDLKDVTLLTFMAMALYYMVVFLQDFPKVKISTMVMLAVSIGLAMAVRVGGLILIAYFGWFGWVRYLMLLGKKQLGTLSAGAAFARLLKYGILTCLGGYLLCILLWPYAMQKPIANVFGALSSMSAFAVSIKQVFEGSVQWSIELPWYYTPKFIFMTIPVAVMVGALIYLVTGWGKEKAFFTFMLLFCFVFPVSWIVYTKANVYGGWRHSMFCYPTLVAMAGLGFHSLYERFKKPALQWGFGVALPLVLLTGPIYHVFANHPYQYVYFNELVGGVKNAYGKYELDYYYHSTRRATEWILEHADVSKLKPGEKFKVATWHTSSVGYYLRKDTAHFQAVFSRIYQMGNNDWDYAVFTITGMNPSWITNKKIFPPLNTVHVEKVNDVPICIVLERTDKSDFYGYQAQQQGKDDTAKMFFQRALQVNPYNKQAIENMIEILLRENQTEYALSLALRLKEIDKDDMAGYWYAAYAYLYQNNIQAALNELLFLVKIQPYAPAYQLMAQIYQVSGEEQAAAQCRQIAAQLEQGGLF